MSILERFLQTVTRSEKREVEFKHTIALRIQSAIEEKNWLQRDLADKMNLSEARISYILKGEANLTLRAIARLEEALDTELLYTERINPEVKDVVVHHIHHFKHASEWLLPKQRYTFAQPVEEEYREHYPAFADDRRVAVGE